MLDRTRIALKEWAVLVRELEEGRRIVLIRKGGILEQKQGFSVEHREFFLFPTYVHQNERELVPELWQRLREVVKNAPPPGELRLTAYARVEESVYVTALEPFKALEGMHALSWSTVESRFRYRRPGLHVLVLRVYQLPKPIVLPLTPGYDGCVSWVDLDDEVPTTGAVPALDDREFSRRVAQLREILIV
ncbi:MAG TPA: DUF1802 family protein [Methylomirabilota bacterium]|nr:DUF1802 family protein [Methylomirabilota bacterium]